MTDEMKPKPVLQICAISVIIDRRPPRDDLITATLATGHVPGLFQTSLACYRDVVGGLGVNNVSSFIVIGSRWNCGDSCGWCLDGWDWNKRNTRVWTKM